MPAYARHRNAKIRSTLLVYDTVLPCLLLVKNVVRAREPSLQPSRCSEGAGNTPTVATDWYLQRRDNSTSTSTSTRYGSPRDASKPFTS